MIATLIPLMNPAHPRTASHGVSGPVLLLLNVEEAANCLGVGRTTIYKLIGNGQLESVKIGRSRRVPYAALQRYVEQLSHRFPPHARPLLAAA
jgi:excisionase family DNA binding protein